MFAFKVVYVMWWKDSFKTTTKCSFMLKRPAEQGHLKKSRGTLCGFCDHNRQRDREIYTVNY